MTTYLKKEKKKRKKKKKVNIHHCTQLPEIASWSSGTKQFDRIVRKRTPIIRLLREKMIVTISPGKTQSLLSIPEYTRDNLAFLKTREKSGGFLGDHEASLVGSGPA